MLSQEPSVWDMSNSSYLMSGKESNGTVASPSIYLKIVLALIVVYLSWEQARFLASR